MTKKIVARFMLPTIILAVTIIFDIACKKEKDCPVDLPCATNTGENTFGCYIDGVAWVSGFPSNVFPLFDETEASYDETDSGGIGSVNTFYLFTHKLNDTIDGHMIIKLGPLSGTGPFYHAGASDFQVHLAEQYYKNDRLSGIRYFRLDTLSDYRIEITKLDVHHNIISGRFSFTGISSGDSITTGDGAGIKYVLYSKPDTLKVTEGRFDVKYTPK